MANQYKVPIADVNVSPDTKGVRQFTRGTIGFVALFAMVGLAGWLFRRGRRAAGVEAGQGFSVEGDF